MHFKKETGRSCEITVLQTHWQCANKHSLKVMTNSRNTPMRTQYLHYTVYIHSKCSTYMQTPYTMYTNSLPHPLMHSCNEQADQFLTQGFNSNHINPPLGTVSMSTRQALSQPLCCLGSVLVYGGSLRERDVDEWMTVRLPEMSLCSLCLPFAEMPGSTHQIKLLYKAKFRQFVCYYMCVLYMQLSYKEK